MTDVQQSQQPQQQQQQLKKPYFITVAQLEPGRHCYNIYVKVVKATESERTSNNGEKVKVVDGVLADSTGCADFKFVGEHTKNIAVGKTVAIRNGRSSVINEHVVLELDKFGKVTVEDDKLVTNPNLEKNISATTWERKSNPKRY